MPLRPEDVSRIADLARLELDPQEAEAMLAQLNGFFAIVERMSAVDTRGVEPLYTPLAAVGAVPLRLRDDVVTEGDRREANQRNAPASKANRPRTKMKASAASKADRNSGRRAKGRSLPQRLRRRQIHPAADRESGGNPTA